MKTHKKVKKTKNLLDFYSSVWHNRSDVFTNIIHIYNSKFVKEVFGHENDISAEEKTEI